MDLQVTNSPVVSVFSSTTTKMMTKIYSRKQEKYYLPVVAHALTLTTLSYFVALT